MRDGAADRPDTWAGYAVRWAALHGGYDPRNAPRLARGWLRLAYLVARTVAGAGATPAAITGFGLLLCLLVPVAAAGPGAWPVAGAALVLVSALADTVDGAVAVLTARASRLGYLYDSVADRIGEAAWLLALWLTGVPAALVLGCAGLVFLHEYVRARATAAGMAEVGAVTVAERPTRVIVTVFALLVAGVIRVSGLRAGALDAAGLATASATVLVAGWVLLGLAGLAQLLRAVTVALAHRPAPVVPPPERART